MQNNKQHSYGFAFCWFCTSFYQAEPSSIFWLWYLNNYSGKTRMFDWFFPFSRLNNLKSDVGAYLADLNLVNSEDTGLVLSLPSDKIPNNLSLTLAGDSLAYTQTTVANLMLVGAGNKLIFFCFLVLNIFIFSPNYFFKSCNDHIKQNEFSKKKRFQS